MSGDHGPYVTKSGKLITDEEIADLVAEAERGYCIVMVEGGRRCFKPLPCPDHGDYVASGDGGHDDDDDPDEHADD